MKTGILIFMQAVLSLMVLNFSIQLRRSSEGNDAVAIRPFFRFLAGLIAAAGALSLLVVIMLVWESADYAFLASLPLPIVMLGMMGGIAISGKPFCFRRDFSNGETKAA